MLYILIVIVCILCAVFLFLYLQLRSELRQLHKQLAYTRKEDAQFTLFTTSSNLVMAQVIDEVNQLKHQRQSEKNAYLKNELEVQDMITNISHDIRTPLTSIQGYVEMVAISEDSDERNRYFEIITNRLHDLESMLDEFFLYTRLINSNEVLEVHSLAVYPFLCNTLLNYMDMINTQHLEPQIQCENEAVCVLAHEESLRRICTNLIMNTIRYGKAPFVIRVEEQTSAITIQFSNHVNAGDFVDVEHMFDRFYKGDRARTQKGSGLGLAIVKELSQRMQGSVEAKLHGDVLQVILKLPKA